mmetsp:Transcript_809/g.1491  ORF Transcript_809/g.1491 Transcript_809/m.1491 type:complete len:214 (-) Transcript_809:867-1508(-)
MTWPVSTRPRRSSRKSWSSCAIRKSSRAWAARSPRARCWWALRAPVRRCWPAPSRVRLACPSSPSPVPTLSRCSWASVPAVCATCSSRRKRTRPASSSSTKSTPWAGPVALATVAAMMSVSRRLTSCWWKWTASRPTRASSSSRQPTAPTYSIPRCCARAASTARFRCRIPTSRAANAFLASTPARCHLAPMWTCALSRAARLGSLAPTSPTW